MPESPFSGSDGSAIGLAVMGLLFWNLFGDMDEADSAQF